MRKSKRSAQTLGDVLKNVVEGLTNTKKSGPTQILELWPQIVGRELSKHTKPVQLYKGKLLIIVDDSAWFYQANLQKEALLKTLTKKLNANVVKSIQFRIGSVNQ